jgi:hypothetical protein
MSGVLRNLDLVAPRRRLHARGLPLLVVGALVCVAALAWAQFDARRLGLAQAELERQTDRLQVRRPGKSGPAPAPPKEDKLSRALLALERELSTPWGELLGAVEAGQTADVALLVVEPSAAERSVRLHLEARHAKAMLAYLAALEADPRLSSVMLLMHQTGTDTAPAAVRFQVQARWGARP